MDYLNYSTLNSEHKRGKHLTFEDRCYIKIMRQSGYSYREIANALNCSPSTIGYELKRGTAEKKSHLGRPASYAPKRGQKVYASNKKCCGRKSLLTRDNPFLKWVVDKVRKDGWSLDACVGYAKRNKWFNGNLVCTKSLYNSLHAGLLSVSLFDVPEVLSRRKQHHHSKVNKRIFGKSMDDRSEQASNGSEFGHWEIDTVVGKRAGKEAVVLTIVEKLTHHFIAMKIAGKTTEAVNRGIDCLRKDYGSQFNQVFKTITADNGSEFSNLSVEDRDRTNIYFAHPYSSWERAQNERHNLIFRRYLPKKHSIEDYSAEQILGFADEMNSIPRKSLGYRTADELFEEYLDKIYAA